MDGLVDFELARGSKPLHTAIADQFAAAIVDGRLPAGTRLSPERQLAASLGVSRMTVRQAFGELERAGLLRRVVGRSGGTFVQDATDFVPGTNGLSAALRRQAGADLAELISAGVEQAGKRTAAALGLAHNDRIVVIARLRLARGKPFGVERSSLPASRFPDIEDMDLTGSLYDLMDIGFGLRPVRALERLETTAARPSDARTIGAKRGVPVLLVERVCYAADGTPVEFARDRYRGDRTALVVESLHIAD
jgi:GntR family transcriptional regulator